MKKRFLSMALCLCMVLTLLPGNAQAAEEEDDNEEGQITASGTWGANLTWMLKDEVLTISGAGKMNRTSEDLYPWCNYRNQIKSVIIGDHIENIADCAFWCHTHISNVTIGDAVKEIGRSAFYNNSSLRHIELPSGLTTIGGSAFQGCGITDIEIPSSVHTIGEGTFDLCKNLSSISVESSNMSFCSIDGVLFNKEKTTLWAYPIGKPDSIYTIPDCVTNICNGVFMYCSNLTDIIMPDSLVYIGDSVLSIGGEFVGYKCPNLTKLTFPEGLKIVRGFSGCANLTEISFPSTVTSIRGFDYCPNLTHIYVSPENEKYYSEDDVLFDKEKSELCIYAPQKPDTTYAIPFDVTTIRECAFQFSENLTSVTIPNNVHSIGHAAFRGCTNLTSIEIPDEITAIEHSIFQFCTNLTRVIIPSSVIGIREAVFDEAPNVTIYCCKGSYAQRYAIDNNIPYVLKEGYNDLMCAIAACQLSYEDGLLNRRGSSVPDFAQTIQKQLWNGYSEVDLADFYSDVLAGWTIKDVMQMDSGFFAVALDDAERDQRIIAFRGTQDFGDIDTDLQFAAWNKLSPQFDEAMAFYTRNSIGNKNILLTGHSLGGALACYVSLLTGERAETFNGANGLIIDDTYFAGVEDAYFSRGEELLSRFHGADRWNFVNHVTQVPLVSVNYPIAYPNADKLPVTVHETSSHYSSAAIMGFDGHGLASMLEYDTSTERFRLTDSTPYNQSLPTVRQFEMRADGKIRPRAMFHFGSSGKDEITDKRLIHRVFLYGGDENDYLVSHCANDVLAGGLGTNVMDGGPMNDRYVITGTDDQYINDCSGKDNIYIPSGVRVSSFEEPASPIEQYFTLALTNGQKIMLNRNRKQSDGTEFYVYSMDGAVWGPYRTIFQKPEAQLMALAAEDEPAAAANGLPITTLEFSGRGLMLEIQDDAGNAVGTVNTASDSFPLYKPYGYFYYDNQEGTLRAHLFGGSGEVRISSTSQMEQIVECAYIFHAASDDLPLKRFTAEIALQSSDTILTPSCSAQEPAVPFRLMDGNGGIQNIPVKTEDLTVSETPSTPGQPTDTPNQPGGSTDTPPSTSSGGGGYSSSSNYSISTPTRVTGGTVKVSPSNARIGVTVTITAIPNSGYELESLTVTDSRDSEIRLTAQGGGKYTFTMPGRAVTVKATFALLPDDTEKPCDGGSNCPSRSFTDLGTVETWYHEAVDYVLRNNLMGGYGNGLFGPNDTLTRAQFAQILYSKEDRPAVADGSNFTDVAPGAWCVPAITWAAERGIVGGYGNGMFGPDDNITREQLAVMLWRYAGSPAATDKELHFTDADKVSGYARDALRWAVENSIINGKGGGILDPKGLATRAQVAQMLKNYLER